MTTAALLIAFALTPLSFSIIIDPIPELCDTAILGTLTTRQLELCTIVSDWRSAAATDRGQFVTQDFWANHVIYGDVVPFKGLFTTAPDSTDRSDVFVARDNIFQGPLIDDFAPINVQVVAVSDEYVVLELNLTGIATETAKSWNSKTTLTYHFVDDELDLGGNTATLIDFLEITSDSDPLVEAFTPTPTTATPTTATPTTDTPTTTTPTTATPTTAAPVTTPTTAAPPATSTVDDDSEDISDDSVESSSDENALFFQYKKDVVSSGGVKEEDRMYRMSMDPFTQYNLYGMVFVFLIVNVTVYCWLNKKKTLY